MSKIPTSRAKTAYGLLSEIAALAMAEPKRISMSDWLLTEKNGGHPVKGFPACGTVACIAGWTTTIRPIAAFTITNEYGPRRTDTADKAQRILGLTDDQASDLFIPEALTEDEHQQTAAHASAVVAHIRKFQKQHRAQLLAKKVR